MEIVLSGLDEDACKAMVGDVLWAQDSVGWLAPDRFLDTPANAAGIPSGSRAVWLYRSLAAMSARAVDESAPRDLQAELDVWLRRNRSALNLRQRFGKGLLFVNVDKVSPADLRAELTGDTAHTNDGHESKAADNVGHVVEDLVGHLFEWISPRYCEVFESLEAASWSLHGVPEFRSNTTPDEAQLIALLELLRLGAESSGSHERIDDHEQTRPGLKQGSAAVKGEFQLAPRSASQSASAQNFQGDYDRLQQDNEKLQLQLHQVQEELEQYFFQSRDTQSLLEAERMTVVEARRVAQEEQQKMRQCELDARQEDELLLVQLHQVQEELERHYLDNTELRKQLAAEGKTLAAAQDNSKALRIQLKQMHKELQGVAQAQSSLLPPAQAAGGRLSRFMPGRIRLKRERKKADKQMQTRLDAIGQSEWFDRKWYLETYPDVASAGMDPIRHYFEFGWKEDRNPSPRFDTSYYLMSNIDVAKSGLNPLWHFIEHGHREGRLARKP